MLLLATCGWLAEWFVRGFRQLVIVAYLPVKCTLVTRKLQEVVGLFVDLFGKVQAFKV
jgi:hypothetical protein